MSATYTLVLDYQRLLNFANGTTVSGFTISTVASATNFTTSVSGVPQPAWDENQAIEVLQAASPSWVFKWILAENAKVIYYFQATY